MDVKDLIKLIKAGATVNVNVAVDTDGNVDTDVDVKQPIDTDFELDERVLVCHRRKDGTPVHTWGTVIAIDTDDVGDYVRIEGDNGKHYKTGTHYNEVRKGTCIVEIED